MYYHNIYILLGIGIIIGLIVGSFGSVLITRLENPTRGQIKSIFVGRSQCPHCHKTLKRHQLIPLYSRINAKGKCTYCKHPIGTLYLHTEIVSMLLITATGGFLQLHHIPIQSLYTMALMLIIRILGLLAIYDRHTQKLHTVLRGIVTVISTLFVAIYYPGLATIHITIAMSITFGIIYLLAKRYAHHRYHQGEGLGGGDLLLSPVIGGLSIMVFHINNVQPTTLNITMYINYYLIIASLATIILFFFSKQKTGPATVAFIPGMVISFIILLYRGSIIL